MSNVSNYEDEHLRRIVLEVLANEREQVEAKLVEQEHRLTQVAYNLYAYGRHENADLRRAAWRALIWKFLAPRPDAIAIVSGGLFTLGLTALGLIIALRANALLERQVERMDVQNMLTEAQRRSAFLTSELNNIIAAIDLDKKASKQDEKELFKVSPGTTGRIVSLSLALRPYRPIEVIGATTSDDADEDVPNESAVSWIDRASNYIFPVKPTKNVYRFSDDLLSPERGQLLLALIPQRLDFDELTKAGATFDFADLSKTRVLNADLTGISLKDANMVEIIMENVKLNYADLDDSNLSDAELENLEFHNTSVSGVNFEDASVNNVDFSGANSIDRNPCRASIIAHDKTLEPEVSNLLGFFRCRGGQIRSFNRDVVEALAKARRPRSVPSLTVCWRYWQDIRRPRSHYRVQASANCERRYINITQDILGSPLP